ncbi:MAG: DUF1761 domain-containing protein [Flavobacteriales bacterium]|nr:DUF1761 domain-containing protein [Flavobacteriales bacterium]MBK9286652.1 DUF1761 domain-containing protein [Flavobacteriales bacterium]
MSITLSNLPWLGIALAFVLSSALGAAWFTALFRKQYLFTLGRPANEPQSKDPIYFVGPMICNFLVILTTAILMQWLNITTYCAAFPFALLVGLGYLVTNTMNIAINPNMPRPIAYGVLTGAYHMVAMVLVCTVLVALK